MPKERDMSAHVETLTKMISQLPANIKESVVNELKLIVSEALDEARWQNQYQTSRDKLAGIAAKVRSEISSGKAKPMDYREL